MRRYNVAPSSLDAAQRDASSAHACVVDASMAVREHTCSQGVARSRRRRDTLLVAMLIKAALFSTLCCMHACHAIILSWPSRFIGGYSYSGTVGKAPSAFRSSSLSFDIALPQLSPGQAAAIGSMTIQVQCSNCGRFGLGPAMTISASQSDACNAIGKQNNNNPQSCTPSLPFSTTGTASYSFTLKNENVLGSYNFALSMSQTCSDGSSMSIGCVTPTPTPSITPTPSRSRSSSISRTATSSLTATGSSTSTLSRSATATSTQSLTGTSSGSSTATSTSSSSRSSTGTTSLTSSSSGTGSATSTLTATGTGSSTGSSTGTCSLTATLTATGSSSSSSSSTSTVSRTGTSTGTSSSTSTRTATSTSSSTSTVSRSSSGTSTSTRTLTGSSTSSSSSTSTVTRSSSSSSTPSGTGSSSSSSSATATSSMTSISSSTGSSTSSASSTSSSSSSASSTSTFSLTSSASGTATATSSGTSTSTVTSSSSSSSTASMTSSSTASSSGTSSLLLTPSSSVALSLSPPSASPTSPSLASSGTASVRSRATQSIVSGSTSLAPPSIPVFFTPSPSSSPSPSLFLTPSTSPSRAPTPYLRTLLDVVAIRRRSSFLATAAAVLCSLRAAIASLLSINPAAVSWAISSYSDVRMTATSTLTTGQCDSIIAALMVTVSNASAPQPTARRLAGLNSTCAAVNATGVCLDSWPALASTFTLPVNSTLLISTRMTLLIDMTAAAFNASTIAALLCGAFSLDTSASTITFSTPATGTTLPPLTALTDRASVDTYVSYAGDIPPLSRVCVKAIPPAWLVIPQLASFSPAASNTTSASHSSILAALSTPTGISVSVLAATIVCSLIVACACACLGGLRRYRIKHRIYRSKLLSRTGDDGGIELTDTDPVRLRLTDASMRGCAAAAAALSPAHSDTQWTQLNPLARSRTNAASSAADVEAELRRTWIAARSKKAFTPRNAAESGNGLHQCEKVLRDSMAAQRGSLPQDELSSTCLEAAADAACAHLLHVTKPDQVDKPTTSRSSSSAAETRSLRASISIAVRAAQAALQESPQVRPRSSSEMRMSSRSLMGDLVGEVERVLEASSTSPRGRPTSVRAATPAVTHLTSLLTDALSSATSLSPSAPTEDDPASLLMEIVECFAEVQEAERVVAAATATRTSTVQRIHDAQQQALAASASEVTQRQSTRISRAQQRAMVTSTKLAHTLQTPAIALPTPVCATLLLGVGKRIAAATLEVAAPTRAARISSAVVPSTVHDAVLSCVSALVVADVLTCDASGVLTVSATSEATARQRIQARSFTATGDVTITTSEARNRAAQAVLATPWHVAELLTPPSFMACVVEEVVSWLGEGAARTSTEKAKFAPVRSGRAGAQRAATRHRQQASSQRATVSGILKQAQHADESSDIVPMSLGAGTLYTSPLRRDSAAASKLTMDASRDRAARTSYTPKIADAAAMYANPVVVARARAAHARVNAALPAPQSPPPAAQPTAAEHTPTPISAVSSRTMFTAREQRPSLTMMEARTRRATRDTRPSVARVMFPQGRASSRATMMTMHAPSVRAVLVEAPEEEETVMVMQESPLVAARRASAVSRVRKSVGATGVLVASDGSVTNPLHARHMGAGGRSARGGSRAQLLSRRATTRKL